MIPISPRTVARIVASTGCTEAQARLAVRQWWASSFMSWCAALTAGTLVGASVIGSTVWQTLDLEHDSRTRYVARGKVVVANQRTLIENQARICARLGVSCSAVVVPAPER